MALLCLLRTNVYEPVRHRCPPFTGWLRTLKGHQPSRECPSQCLIQERFFYLIGCLLRTICIQSLRGCNNVAKGDSQYVASFLICQSM